MNKKKKDGRHVWLVEEKETSGQAEADARSQPTNIIRGGR